MEILEEIKNRTKFCTICKTDKLLDAFYNKKGRMFGKDGRCIECRKTVREKYETDNYRRIVEQKIDKRVCKTCGIEKSILCFNRSKSGYVGRVANCTVCLKPISHRKYISRKKLIRNRDLQYKYGINQKGYDNMFLNQGGVCKICNKESNRNLHIDHNHETGKIRGLLCGSCNVTLGTVEENIDTLQNMITYLQNQ